MAHDDLARDPLRNRLLAALPGEIQQRLLLDLTFEWLELGQQIYAVGERLASVYFPTTAIISLLYSMENGSSAEIGIVGNDGILGIALFMGGGSVPNDAIVQSAGGSFCMTADTVASAFKDEEVFQRLMLRYTQALIAQMSQTAVCNRHHSVDQQLCRWLLLSHDRLVADDLVMTQELIANMLGVRREAVSRQAARLQQARLIDYNRGKITIVDRAGLEAQACECYDVVRRETERLMGNVT